MGGRFDGSVVWITGGGSGIGRALALELAREGAHVAVSGRRLDRLEAVAQEVEGLGRQGLAIPCDVTDERSIEAAVAAVLERFGRLDVAIANAGFGVSGRLENLTVDSIRRQFDVNVVGAAATAKAALPALRETSGRLVLIASVAGLIVAPGTAIYSASKFALRAIGLGLSQELHGSGVTCTTIHPGFVESEIAQVDNRGVHHPDRKDRRPAKLMWKTDRAARVMARAIHKRKREFVFTGHGKIGAFLGKHAPGVVHFAVTRSGAVSKSERITAAKRQ